MSNEFLFGTQVLSLLAYIGSLFFIYRVLVAQKDATIENLKTRLEEAKEKSPDALLQRARDRLKFLEEELAKTDKSNSDLINQKTAEIEQLTAKSDSFEKELATIRDMAGELFCPECNAIVSEKAYHSEIVEYNGRDADIDHEWIQYSCGRTLADGRVVHQCDPERDRE